MSALETWTAQHEQRCGERYVRLDKNQTWGNRLIITTLVTIVLGLVAQLWVANSNHISNLEHAAAPQQVIVTPTVKS